MCVGTLVHYAQTYKERGYKDPAWAGMTLTAGKMSCWQQYLIISWVRVVPPIRVLRTTFCENTVEKGPASDSLCVRHQSGP